QPALAPELGTRGRRLGAALDRLVLADRLPSEPAAAAIEIALDEQPRDLFEPPPQRPLSPLASPLLGAMDNGVLQTLVEVAQAEACAAGEVVFREGATGDALYVILRGAVDVIRQGRDGEEPKVLAHLRAGSFFGEMSLITNEPRSATVVATEDC